MEPWKVCRLVITVSRHLYKEQDSDPDPDPCQSESRIRIRIEVKRGICDADPQHCLQL